MPSKRYDLEGNMATYCSTCGRHMGTGYLCRDCVLFLAFLNALHYPAGFCSTKHPDHEARLKRYEQRASLGLDLFSDSERK